MPLDMQKPNSFLKVCGTYNVGLAISGEKKIGRHIAKKKKTFLYFYLAIPLRNLPIIFSILCLNSRTPFRHEVISAYSK